MSKCVLLCLVLATSQLTIAGQSHPHQKTKPTLDNTHTVTNKEKKLAGSQAAAFSLVASKQQRDSFLHPAATKENWLFSGIVVSELGTGFGYYFAVMRHGNNFEVVTRFTQLDTEAIVLAEHIKTTLDISNQQGINFKLKQAFLRYDSITDSWLFGIEGKQGFNFRVEALKKQKLTIEHLTGLTFYNLQSMRINGHLHLKEKSEFVTAKNAWLSHQWRNEGAQSFNVQRLLCRLDDYRGFSVERIKNHKKLLLNSASLLSPRGVSQPVTQFSVISKGSANQWQIKLLSPALYLNLFTPEPLVITQNNHSQTFYSGVAKRQKGKKGGVGYCLLIHSKANSVKAKGVLK